MISYKMTSPISYVMRLRILQEHLKDYIFANFTSRHIHKLVIMKITLNFIFMESLLRICLGLLQARNDVPFKEGWFIFTCQCYYHAKGKLEKFKGATGVAGEIYQYNTVLPICNDHISLTAYIKQHIIVIVRRLTPLHHNHRHHSVCEIIHSDFMIQLTKE